MTSAFIFFQLLLTTPWVSCADDTPMADFSLKDATGRDIFKEATHWSKREHVRKGRHTMKLMAPVSPLRMHFESHNRTFSYDLHKVPSVFAAGAIMTVVRENGSVDKPADEAHIYRSIRHDAVLSMIGTSFHGLVRFGESFFDFHTERNILNVTESNTGGLHNAKHPSGVSSFLPADNLHGAARPSENESSVSQRRLAFGNPTTWSSCYTDDHVTKALKMGNIIASKLASNFADENAASEWLQSVYAKTNLVYKPQMNFVLEIERFIFQATSSGAPAWDQGSSCPMSIDAQLGALEEWTPPVRLGLWHVFDDCFPGAGTIGLAYVDVLCMMDPSSSGTYYNTGVTWYSGSTWKTFAHEVGHNFGGQHSFENGQGSTGGIMDYGDGTYEGLYQFNSPLRKAEMCTTMKNAVDGSCTAIDSFAAECGNGILESGETCECVAGSVSCSYCECCQLASGKECTPVSSATCCGSDGMFLTPSTSCTSSGTAGYCDKGECVTTHTCTVYSSTFGDFCGLMTSNPCELMCVHNGACADLSGWQDGTTKLPLNRLTDGTTCVDAAQGPGLQCKAGVCENPLVVQLVNVATGPPTPNTKGNTGFTVTDCDDYQDKGFLGYADIVLPDKAKTSYTRAECQAACEASPCCRSFTFGRDNNHCELWMPTKLEEDLATTPGYDTYICNSRATDCPVDCDKWEQRTVLGAVGEVSLSSTPGKTLAECNALCLADSKCHLFTFGTVGSVAGMCELWEEDKGDGSLRRPATGDTVDAYVCPCRGATKICDCSNKDYLSVRIGCKCAAGSTTNECAAGKYCWTDNTCNDAAKADRRLTTCPTPAPTNSASGGSTPSPTDEDTLTTFVDRAHLAGTSIIVLCMVAVSVARSY